MSELEPTYFPAGELLADIRALIAQARRQTTVAVNRGLTLLYWRIGQRIHREVLGSERAAYGEQIVVTVSRQLVMDYGRGYVSNTASILRFRHSTWSYPMASYRLFSMRTARFFSKRTCRSRFWSSGPRSCANGGRKSTNRLG